MLHVSSYYSLPELKENCFWAASYGNGKTLQWRPWLRALHSESVPVAEGAGQNLQSCMKWQKWTLFDSSDRSAAAQVKPEGWKMIPKRHHKIKAKPPSAGKDVLWPENNGKEIQKI